MAENKDSRTVGLGLLVTAVLALILLFMGTALIAYGFALLTHPLDITQVYWTDVKDNTVLETDELRVIDPFLSTDGALGKTTCCLVSYKDASGDMCIGALTVPESSPLSGVISEYAADKSAALGQFTVEGYFTLTDMDGFGAHFGTAYTDACKTYAEVLTELSGRHYNGNVRETALVFSYICGLNDNYLAAQGHADRVSGVIGIVIASAGAAGAALTAAALIRTHRRRSLAAQEH